MSEQGRHSRICVSPFDRCLRDIRDEYKQHDTAEISVSSVYICLRPAFFSHTTSTTTILLFRGRNHVAYSQPDDFLMKASLVPSCRFNFQRVQRGVHTLATYANDRIDG